MHASRVQPLQVIGFAPRSVIQPSGAGHVIITNVLAPETVMAGKYVIVRPLESGGMGDVYDAWQKDLSRPVAIKLLRADVMADPAMFLRFRREAEAAASLGHPNIVRVLDFRNDPDEQPMLIMEKLEGKSLRELLGQEGMLTPPRAVFIALQILSALGAAHDAKIVHRDVKPANVFILKTFAVRDFVKVLDFGVAKVLEPGEGPALTDLGQVLGTASYMAPEQAKGLQVDGRADLFAVGGILFEAMTGKRPRELGPAGIIDAGMKPCLKLQSVMPHVDPRLAAAVDRALALDRAARFPTAEAMAKALAPFAPQQVTDVTSGQTERTVQDAPMFSPSAPSPSNAVTATGAPISAPPFSPPATKYVGPQQQQGISQPPSAPRPGESGPQLPAHWLPPAPLGPQPSISIPPAAGSSPHPIDPTRLSPQGSIPPPPRTSYQPPLMQHVPSMPVAHGPITHPPPAPAPIRSAKWSGLAYAIPVAIVAGLVLLVVLFIGGFLALGFSGNERDREFIRNAQPGRCAFPTKCTGRTTSHNDKYAVCSPASANQYRAGDLVFYGTSSTSRPATFVGTGSSGRIHIETSSGRSEEISSSELVGAYCQP
jgi:serine/threonine-protein kinase